MKKPPKLADLFGGKKKAAPAKPKTSAELLAIAMQWHQRLTPPKRAKPPAKTKPKPKPASPAQT